LCLKKFDIGLRGDGRFDWERLFGYYLWTVQCSVVTIVSVVRVIEGLWICTPEFNFGPSVSRVPLIYEPKCFGDLITSGLSENGCDMCIPTGFF
jgi:hypothetical protein